MEVNGQESNIFGSSHGEQFSKNRLMDHHPSSIYHYHTYTIFHRFYLFIYPFNLFRLVDNDIFLANNYNVTQLCGNVLAMKSHKITYRPSNDRTAVLFAEIQNLIGK